jgi:cyanate permease
VLTAGLVWGFYNAALGVVFGFGPLMLVERGWTLAAASSATSIVLWLVVISVPLGGVIADRSGAYCHPHRQLRRVCRGAAGGRPVGYNGCGVRRTWAAWRTWSGADHEPAIARAEA